MIPHQIEEVHPLDEPWWDDEVESGLFDVVDSIPEPEVLTGSLEQSVVVSEAVGDVEPAGAVFPARDLQRSVVISDADVEPVGGVLPAWDLQRSVVISDVVGGSGLRSDVEIDEEDSDRDEARPWLPS